MKCSPRRGNLALKVSRSFLLYFGLSLAKILLTSNILTYNTQEYFIVNIDINIYADYVVFLIIVRNSTFNRRFSLAKNSARGLLF